MAGNLGAARKQVEMNNTAKPEAGMEVVQLHPIVKGRRTQSVSTQLKSL